MLPVSFTCITIATGDGRNVSLMLVYRWQLHW